MLTFPIFFFTFIHSVRRKASGKALIKDIAEIVERHSGQTGIIYCLATKECEDVCNALLEAFGPRHPLARRITFYHAQLTAAERERRQREWTQGRVLLICATIAFGMGINKPDVRYVIHHSMPKSIDGYSQESGRAGRDGNQSESIVFFGFKDKSRLQHMITRAAEERAGSGGGRGFKAGGVFSDDSVQRSIQLLSKCAAYCVNEVECRRVLLLRYFGEEFSPEQCRGTCDNCRRTQRLSWVDMTPHAYVMLLMVHATSSVGTGARGYPNAASKPMTIVQLATRYSLKDVSKLDEAAGRTLALRPSVLGRDTAERLVQVMVLEGLLQEDTVVNQSGFGSDYVSLGPRAGLLLRCNPQTAASICSFRATDEAGQPYAVRVAVRAEGRSAGALSTEQVDMLQAPTDAAAPVVEEAETADDATKKKRKAAPKAKAPNTVAVPNPAAAAIRHVRSGGAATESYLSESEGEAELEWVPPVARSHNTAATDGWLTNDTGGLQLEKKTAKAKRRSVASNAAGPEIPVATHVPATKRARQLPASLPTSSVTQAAIRIEQSPASQDSRASAIESSVPRQLLSNTKMDELRTWVMEWLILKYGSKRVYHFLTSDQIGLIAFSPPVTREQLLKVPRISEAKLDTDGFGAELLATVFAFLEKHDLLHLFPHAQAPTIAEHPRWRNPLACPSQAGPGPTDAPVEKERPMYPARDSNSPTWSQAQLSPVVPVRTSYRPVAQSLTQQHGDSMNY